MRSREAGNINERKNGRRAVEKEKSKIQAFEGDRARQGHLTVVDGAVAEGESAEPFATQSGSAVVKGRLSAEAFEHVRVWVHHGLKPRFAPW